MTNEEYSLLFHRAQLNLVAFRQVNHCDDELRKMLEMAVADEREACAKVCDEFLPLGNKCAYAIKARGNT